MPLCLQVPLAQCGRILVANYSMYLCNSGRPLIITNKELRTGLVLTRGRGGCVVANNISVVGRPSGFTPQLGTIHESAIGVIMSQRPKTIWTDGQLDVPSALCRGLSCHAPTWPRIASPWKRPQRLSLSVPGLSALWRLYTPPRGATGLRCTSCVQVCFRVVASLVGHFRNRA